MAYGVTGPNHGGFSAVARALSTDEKPVTRQRVYMWYKRRERNGFPERDTRGFSFAEVAAWYAEYLPNHGGRPWKEAG